MAQTIALQRGTTTVAGSGASSVTLFTQSGGTATRVILNQLSFYNSTSASNSSSRVLVYLTSSGGQTSVLGYLFGSNGTGYSYQFLPGGGNSNVGAGVSTAVLGQCPVIQSSNTSADIGTPNPSNVSASFDTSTGRNQAIFPSNFWMGPSDSIKIKAYQSYTSGKSTLQVATVNIGYSFTTITES